MISMVFLVPGDATVESSDDWIIENEAALISLVNDPMRSGL
jgi:hypothetical protein